MYPTVKQISAIRGLYKEVNQIVVVVFINVSFVTGKTHETQNLLLHYYFR